jgi:phage/plasmid-associated DNA primase
MSDPNGDAPKLTDVKSKRNRHGQAREGKDRRVLGEEPELQKKSEFEDLSRFKFYEKKWYVYNSELGFFEQKEENYIGHLIQKECRDISTHNINDRIGRIRFAVNYEKGFYRAIKFDEETGDLLINTPKKVVRVRQGIVSVEAHKRSHMFGAAIAANYDLSAKCETFNKVLEKCLPDLADRKVVVWLAASALIPDCRFNIAGVMLGDTHTGKSTIWEDAFGSVFGPSLKDCVTLSRMCPNAAGRDSNYRLNDKLLNIATELNPNATHANTESLKRQISGEGYISEKKYGGELTCVNYCKLMFLCNELPKIDGTEADSVRLRLIRFDHSHFEDKDYSIREVVRTEKDGIFSQVLISGLLELLQMREIPRGGSTSQRWEDKLRANINLYAGFVRSRAELEPEWETRSEHMDQEVYEYLHEKGLWPNMSLEKFKKRLRDRYDLETKQKGKHPNRYSVWVGIKLKNPWKNETQGGSI